MQTKKINGLMELIKFLNSVDNPDEWRAVDDADE